MKLQTIIEIPKSELRLNLNKKVMVLGSCFADEIGKKLRVAGFDVCVNPFGTLYNPVSIANAIGRLRSRVPFRDSECVQMGSGSELVCTFSHHTSFARQDSRAFLEDANKAFVEACDFWEQAEVVMVTLGTAFCWLHEGEVVANCLKRPAKEFSRKRLSPSEVASMLRAMMCQGKQFIFTVSPIRHLGDGAHINNLSKGSLLLGVEEALSKNPQNSTYFPSYEIVMDELRDYRFYAEDLVHPNSLAIEYVWERFCAFAIDSEDYEKMAANEKEYRRSQHRPIH